MPNNPFNFSSLRAKRSNLEYHSEPFAILSRRRRISLTFRHCERSEAIQGVNIFNVIHVNFINFTPLSGFAGLPPQGGQMIFHFSLSTYSTPHPSPLPLEREKELLSPHPNPLPWERETFSHFPLI